MNFYDIQIVLQEVPGQISICFSITGCNLHCKGCHSPHLWKKELGKKLTTDKYLEVIHKYKGFATCVLFMGGEWHQKVLIEYLEIAKKMGYETCLYTGLSKDKLSSEILTHLTWLKFGAWIEELGGLNSPITNQKFIDIKQNKILNHLFKI
ncbi:MAG TPA: anaerobic ribonucleoside-triphosphate reductase activating protein [Crocinitomix sp.]|nr:anaerobic ribonucleoside-triphosphate reductase activating protein [Crocinitomix sp.]